MLTNKSKLAYINPDRAGKAHLPSPRFGDVSTACGGALLFLEWKIPASEVAQADRCSTCWERADA